MPRIQTNPTQLTRACHALGLPEPDATATRLVNYLEAERMQRKVDHLKRAAGEAAPVRIGRPGWHPAVRHIKEELRQHLRDVERCRAAFNLRYGNLFASASAKRAQHSTMLAGVQVYDFYIERLSQLYQDVTERLRVAGFLDAAGTVKQHADVSVFVANERAEGRHAGLAHWSQWEDPRIVRNMRRMFNELYTAYSGAHGKERLRRMMPYFNSATQARLREAWDQALTQTFGWGAAATNLMELVETSPPVPLSEEQRAALRDYFAFTSSPGFKRACDDIATACVSEGKQAPYSSDPLTGRALAEPWRKLDDDMLLRLHALVLEVQLAELPAEMASLLYETLPMPDTQSEVDARRLFTQER